MHLFIIPEWFNHLSVLSVAAVAVWKGRRPVQIAGVANLVNGVASHFLIEQALSARWSYAHWRGAALLDDLVTLAILAACAVVSRRYWAICASSFALLWVVTDVLFLSARHYSNWALGSANVIWAYGLGVAILWGAFSEPRRGATASTTA